MSEEGERVPFKLERRTSEDQVVNWAAKVGLLRHEVESLTMRVNELQHRMLEGGDARRELEQKFSEAFGQGNVVKYGPNALWPKVIEERLIALERMHPIGDVTRHSHHKSALSWSKEVPTKHGFYWVRILTVGLPEPCEVLRLEDGSLGVLLLRGGEPWRFDRLTANREWYGPIEPPE